jgi:hypothetical protein
MNTELTKKEIFQFFYSKQQVTRKGGGMMKSRMCKNSVSYINVSKLEHQIILLNDTCLLKYYKKLVNRDSNLAPPPTPK